MTVAAFRRENRGPALLAAVVLHVALFAAVVWFSRPAFLPMGTAVPINLVASGPTTDSRPAEQAPIAQDAQTPAPVPEAKAPLPPPPPPEPRPVAKVEPPRPMPKPRPTPTPKPQVKPKPAPARLSPAQDSFSLDALQASISKAVRHSPPAPASARRGPARAETALVARVDAGTGLSQSDIAGLTQLLQRLWNPDCSVDDRAIIPVTFTVSYDGHLQGRVNAGGRENSPNPVIYAAARRAIDAVHEAAPYAPTYRGLTITVNFNAAKACADR
jgi:outer membrane biosynthesis protein TonB